MGKTLIEHVESTIKLHPGKKLRDVLKIAKKTYLKSPRVATRHKKTRRRHKRSTRRYKKHKKHQKRHHKHKHKRRRSSRHKRH